MKKIISVLVGLAASMGVAAAYPNGAPWGTADPNAAQNCSSCHFDGEPVLDSQSISISGLRTALIAGRTYVLLIQFERPDDKIVGFSAISKSKKNIVGSFITRADGVDTQRGEIRSTAPARIGDIVFWRVEWRAPERIDGDITFYVAANFSNDDQSAFGDQIHFRSFQFHDRQEPE